MESMSRKEVAISFLKLASSGQVDEAYEKFVSQEFKHHNPHFEGAAAALKAGMKQSTAMFPNRSIQTLRALEDGDLVAVHSLVKLKPEDLGIAVIHLFRFEGDFIVEEWEAALPIPESSPNKNGCL